MAKRADENVPKAKVGEIDTEKSGKKLGRPPMAEGVKHNVLSIRGTTEWRDWLNRLADHCRLKTADVIDHAIIAYAKQQGFKEQPPKR